MTAHGESAEKPIINRGARTRGHIAGKWVDGHWNPADEQWLVIAGAYCPRFRVAVLALVAVKAEQAVEHVD